MNAENTKEAQYTVVARRYRPQSFGDLVGQNHISQALGNAIKQNRVGHAYLFTGARGVGKTSSARIFAKCLNCQNGPAEKPCNECDICEAVSLGEDVDVLEIDGASNRGIDEIRQLRSNANVRPSRARYKIYIIDEVHMLTSQAFNALLKTLEEPPEHVKFIFCTTDPQKMPITVLSRCQRYDFSPVQTDKITNRLAEICKTENIEADEEALKLLARRAGGSMRDSQSLLEQLFSFCGEDITVAEVHQLLGTAGMGQVLELAKTICARDAAASLNLVSTSVSDGVDSGQLTNQLLGLFRDTMAVRVGANSETLLYASESDIEALKSLAEDLGLEKILSIVQILDNTIVRMQSSMHPRTLLEVAVVRICNLENLDSLADLINQLPATTAGGASAAPAKKKTSSPPRESTSPQTASPVTASVPQPTASAAQPVPKPAVLAAAPVEPAADTINAVADLPAIELVPANLKSIWAQSVSALGGLTSQMASSFTKIELADGDQVVVTFGDRYTQDECNKPERRNVLESALRKIVGRSVKLDLRVDEAQLASSQSAKPHMTRMQMQRQVEQHPFVKSAIEIFQAEVVDFKAGPQG